MERKKSRALTFLLIVGILMIAAGGFFLTKIGTSHVGANGNGTTRASTSIEFGADFYTTSAQYTGLAANAAVDLYDLTAMGMGAFFIFAGLTEICVGLALKKKETDEMETQSDDE